MVYVYAVIAGASDVLSGWFALRQRADRIEPRYVIGMAFILSFKLLVPIA